MAAHLLGMLAELRAAALHAAATADSAPHALAAREEAEAASSPEDVMEIADRLIGEFRTRKPAAWRKLIGFSKRWTDLADPVFARCASIVRHATAHAPS